MEGENKCCLQENWKEPKVVITFLAVIILGAIIIVSILRDRIVNDFRNQVTVVGRGEVEYKPDMADITLGVQIDKAANPETALAQMNEKIGRIIGSLKSIGISEDDIETKTYNLYPQYDYVSGISSVSGYNANQQISVKVREIGKDNTLVNKVVAESSKAGANQVLGVSYEISSLNDLKQEARVKAIQDAQSKSQELAQAAGIKRLGKVISWYENLIQSPDYGGGLGGYGAGEEAMSSKTAPSPEIPSGTQKIVIEMGVQYQVK
jgi:uncharacterized protein YggE